MRTVLFAAALAASSSAWAAPMQMSYSARVTDDLGNPAQGSTAVTVSLYTQQSSGTPFWTQDYTPDVQDGFFTLILDTSDTNGPLDSDMFDGDVYVGLTVASATEMSPRNLLLSVPRAAYADGAGVAQTADTATTATSLLSPSWGRLIVDTNVSNFNMPAEWTPSFLDANIGRTWIWSDNGPNFRDSLHCNPNIQVYDQETAWKGQYIATVAASNRVHVQWSGWYLRVNDPNGSVLAQANGFVSAELSLESGVWRVQHMTGFIGNYGFSCA